MQHKLRLDICKALGGIEAACEVLKIIGTDKEKEIAGRIEEYAADISRTVTKDILGPELFEKDKE